MLFQAWTLRELLYYLSKLKEQHGEDIAVGTLVQERWGEKLTWINMKLIVVNTEKEFFIREYGEDGSEVMSKSEKLAVEIS